ncbi:substrate-binding domain-containing protein [Pseudoalteromonas sp. GB56]
MSFFVRVFTFSLLNMMALVSVEATAKLTLAVVGKTKNDTFYQASFSGCKAFTESHPDVECIYDGSDDYQDVRTQVLIVEELLNQDIDGLLVSTTDSEFLAGRALTLAQRKGIPVVTFDSDLLPQHAHFRLAYVGTNNFDFGVALGEAAKKFSNQENQSVCIQSGHETTPNLNERIKGVRYALSGRADIRLDGRSGWTEHPRCPLYTLGRRDEALAQLMTLISYDPRPMFIGVAGFAQFNSKYIEQLAPHKALIENQELVIVSADTEQEQLLALADGLSSINIGQDPFEMGRKGAELLYDFIKHGKKPSQEHYYLPFHYCTRDNAMSCTQ